MTNPTHPKSLTRREWLSTGMLGVLAASVATTPTLQAAEVAKPAGALRFSSWLTAVRGDLDKQMAFVERSGFEAVEFRGSLSNKASWIQALRKSSLKVSALDAGHFGGLVSGSAQARQKTIDSLKASIEAAHQLTAPSLICVPPRLGQGELPDSITTRKILLETLIPLGELASQAGTCIGIEAVRRKSVNCLHTLVEVAGFCRESKSPGLGLVADFCIMMEEETNQTGAFLSGSRYLRQVHLSSRGRKLPGQEAEDEQQFLEGFRGLKMINYQGFCSFECGKIDTYEEEVIKSMAFLRNIWARA
jgi:sugar phosphate isomerase/epimerase